LAAALGDLPAGHRDQQAHQRHRQRRAEQGLHYLVDIHLVSLSLRGIRF
jgi:hypothetical protein